jgi:hypothetical protein
MFGRQNAATIEETLSHTRDAIAAERLRADQLDAESRAAADDSEKFHRLAAAAAEARREADRLELVAGRLEDELESARIAGEAAAYEEKRQQAERAHAAAAKKSAAAAQAIAAAKTVIGELQQARGRADELGRAAEQLRPEHVERPAYSDEPEWLPQEELAGLAEVLAAGPRRPVATEEERVSRRDEEDARQAALRLPHVVRKILTDGREGPSLQAFSELQRAFLALPDDERAEALRRAEASLGDVEAEIRAEFRRPDSLPGQELAEARKVARVRGEIQGRIDRLGELIAAGVS